MVDHEPKKIELEAKLMFLERAVEVMHEVMLDQSRTIETLERRLDALEQSRPDPDGDDQLGPHHDPPPHY